MKLRLVLVALCAALTLWQTQAAFACDALSRVTPENRHFGSRIPMHADDTGAWLATKNTMSNRFDIGPAEQHLLRVVRADLARRGFRLTLLLAPPRVAYLPRDLVAEAAMYSDRRTADAYGRAYRETIRKIKETGVLTADLLDLAAAYGAPFFKRDMHWTAAAAASAAYALSNEIGLAPGITFPVLDERVEMQGKLDAIHVALCDSTPMLESSMSFETPPSDGGLLEARPPQIAYAGTSFSVSNGAQMAEHIEYFTGVLVVDFSVEGGGAEGALISALFSLDGTDHDIDTLVWEIPYINSLSQNGFLRHIAGFLRAGAAQGVQRYSVKDLATYTEIPIPAQPGDLVVTVMVPDPAVDRVDFDLTTADGRWRRNVMRSRHVPATLRPSGFHFYVTAEERTSLQRLRVVSVGRSSTQPVDLLVGVLPMDS